MSPNPPKSTGRLRRLDPQKDLESVAKLIEQSFSLQNDPDGQAILRQMRSTAQKQRKVLIRLPMSSPDGFVWEDEGKIVGNLSLIRYNEGLRRILLIANVAVEPSYRNLGIASALTRHALRFAATTLTGEIWLQVRSDNASAIHLYEGLGFRFHSHLNQWLLPARTRSGALEPPPGYQRSLSNRRLADWLLQKTWLEQAYPIQTRWYLNLDFPALSPWSWLNPAYWETLLQLRHYCLRSPSALEGVLILQSTTGKADRLWLACPSGHLEDEIAQSLVKSFLTTKWSGKQLTLEFPRERAELGLKLAGFQFVRSLDWMQFQG